MASALKETHKAMRDDSGRTRRAAFAARAERLEDALLGKTSRTRSVTAKVVEGAGKANDPLLRSSSKTKAVPHRYSHFEPLKVMPTPRELPGALRCAGIPPRLEPL
jgi:hypothetical protein